MVKDFADGAMRLPSFRAALNPSDGKSERREIRTPNLLIWSQTRYRCATHPMLAIATSAIVACALQFLTVGLRAMRAIHWQQGSSMCWPPWPNGQGVGLLIRRLRVRVPQGVFVSERNTRSRACSKIPAIAIDGTLPEALIV